MGLRTILIVILAVVFGVSAAALAMNAVNQHHQEANPENEPVVVAKDNIKRGTKITRDHLDLKFVPKGSAPAGSLSTIESALGQRVQIPLVKNEYVMGAKLGTGTNIMTTDIPTGMQISSIEVRNVAQGVAGFVQPGDIVDILLTVDHFQEKDTGGTVRLMQMVEVRGVDNRTSEETSMHEGKIGEGAARSITVLVTPKQAQELADAQKRGALTIVLRGPDDKTIHPYEVITPRDLKFPEQPAEEKKEELPAPTVEKPFMAPPIRVFKGAQEVPNP